MNHHHQSNQNHSQQPNHPNYHQHHPTPISLTPQQQQVLLQSQAQLIQQQQQLIQQQQQQHQRIQANQHHNHKSSSSSSSSSSSQTRINSQHPNHQANILQHHQQQQQPLLLPKHHSIQQPSPNQHHPSINPIKRPSPSYNEVLGPNTALSRAKRFRPTDRTLPVFEPADPNAPRYSLDGLIPERQNIIYRMSKNYERLQKIEQEFDWLISRKRFEIEDLLRRTNGVQRRLRIKVWNTVSNQSWQQSSSRSTSTTSNVKSNRTKTCDQTTDHDQKPQEEDPEPENQGDDDDDDDDDDDENQPEADPNESSGVPSSGTPGLTGINFNSGEGIPKWTLHLEAHLIPPQCPCAPSSEPDQDSVGNEPSPPEIKIVETPRPFSTLLNAVLIKINRSEELYPEPNFVEWHRPTSTTTTTSSTISNSHQPFSTITMSRSGSENCWVDIALHLNHYPQRFKISPILGSFLDLNEASLDELFESIWCYIKKNKLIDNGLDKRLIRKDSNLGCLFPPSVDRIQFHQLAEQVRKYLGVPEPALIRYEIKVDKENQNRAEYFDIQFSIEDPAKLHLINIKNQLEDVHLPAPSQNQAHKDPVSITKEILALDEQIMDSIAKIREVKIRRDFYKRFTNDPIKFIEEWIGSQSRDLEILFGLDKGSEGTSVNSMLYHPRMNSKNRGLFDEAQTHPDGLLDFDHLKRYSKFYDQPWVEDAVKIYQSRDFNQQVFQQSNLKPPTSNLNPHHNNTIPMVHMNPNNHLVGLSSSNPNNPTAASSVGVSSMVGNLNHGNGHINPHHAHPPHQMLTSTNNPTGKGSIASHSNPGAMPNSISSIPNSHANGLSTATHMAPTGHNHPPNSNGPNHPNLRGSR